MQVKKVVIENKYIYILDEHLANKIIKMGEPLLNYSTLSNHRIWTFKLTIDIENILKNIEDKNYAVSKNFKLTF